MLPIYIKYDYTYLSLKIKVLSLVMRCYNSYKMCQIWIAQHYFIKYIKWHFPWSLKSPFRQCGEAIIGVWYIKCNMSRIQQLILSMFHFYAHQFPYWKWSRNQCITIAEMEGHFECIFSTPHVTKLYIYTYAVYLCKITNTSQICIVLYVQ